MSTYRLKGTSGSVINESWTLQESTVIGSDDDCDIRVAGEAVASRHAEVGIESGQVHVRLLAAQGDLYVNGEKTGEASLASGDEIRIGPCRWLLQAPGLRPGKVLTEEAVRRRRPVWPWLLAGALSALALAAWRLGYLPF